MIELTEQQAKEMLSRTAGEKVADYQIIDPGEWMDMGHKGQQCEIVFQSGDDYYLLRVARIGDNSSNWEYEYHCRCPRLKRIEIKTVKWEVDE